MIPEGSCYPIKVMWETAEMVLSNAQHVIIPDIFYAPIVKDIIEFEKHLPGSPYPRGVRSEEEVVMYYLIRDSVNFCYWYGCPSTRPNGSCSSKIAEILSDEFERTRRGPLFVESVIFQFKQKLKKERFPWISERINCLDEIVDDESRERILYAVKISPDNVLEVMIECYPLYTSDMFLKRASLFVEELSKSSTWTIGTGSSWMKDIFHFPVPADYHLPNVLRSMGLIVYKPELAEKVDHNVLLPKGSEEEVEIRAATIHICQKLSLIGRTPPPIIDDYLFSKRHEALKVHPFHLTITTDY